MRHQVVKKIVQALAATSLAAAALFAYLVTPGPAAPGPGAAAPAEELFRAHCATCHPVEELLGELCDANRERSVVELTDFLAGHGTATGAQNRALAELLTDLAWPP